MAGGAGGGGAGLATAISNLPSEGGEFICQHELTLTCASDCTAAGPSRPIAPARFSSRQGDKHSLTSRRPLDGNIPLQKYIPTAGYSASQAGPAALAQGKCRRAGLPKYDALRKLMAGGEGAFAALPCAVK